MEEIDLKELIETFLQKKFLIIFIVVLFAILGVIYTKNFITPTYAASTDIILKVNDLEKTLKLTSESVTTKDTVLNSKLIDVYAVVAKSKKVANKVIENLKLDITSEELTKTIITTSNTGTQTLKITAYSKNNPEEACKIANETAKIFIEEVKNIYEEENLYILDLAEIDSNPTNINLTKNILIFAFVGFVAISAYILVIFMFDTTIKKEEDIENALNIPVLATVVLSKEKTNSIESEIFKNLRTNIQFRNTNSEKKVMLITSTISGEGKTYVSYNLATAFAKLNKKVLIIDTNMRNASQHTLFNLKETLGISNFLSENLNKTTNKNKVNIADFVQETNINNLYLISAGNLLENPSELLASEKLEKAIKTLKESYDFIILDSPACSIISDALITSRVADLTIIVSAQNITKLEDLKKVKNDIEKVGGNVTGVVLNKVKRKIKF